MVQNFAPVGQNDKSQHKHNHHGWFGMIAGAVCLVIGLAMVGPSLWDTMQLNALAESAVATADECAHSGDSPASSADSEGQVASNSAEQGNDSGSNTSSDQAAVDWDSLRKINPSVCGWIRCPTKAIDFPVVKGKDNSYYLHHDIYGRYSYCGVFLDYRDDPNGRNVVIFGHTLRHGGMFRPISTAMNQADFNTIGTVWYATPEAGMNAYTPVCALSVNPDYEPVQTFEFVGSATDYDEALYNARQKVLSEHAQKSEYNVVVPTGSVMNSDTSMQVSASNIDAEHVAFWQLTDEEEAACESLASKESNLAAYRYNMLEILADSTAKRADAENLIMQSKQAVTLVCCTWPFNSHRTVLVCVR